MCKHQAHHLSVSRADECNTTKAMKKKFKYETIVSQNLLGLKSDARVEELFYILKKRNLFAICLQETWREGIETLENENCLLLLSGLKKDEMKSKRGERGVGLALSSTAVEGWKRAGKVLYNEYEGRIIAIRLIVKDNRGKDIGLFLVSAYCPVGNSDPENWELFLEQVRSCISKKQKDDILIVGTDCNSSLGTVSREDQATMTSVGPYGNPHMNASGLRLRSYLEVNALAAVTTYFRKKNYSTWSHPRSKKPHQIDHFLTEKKSFSRFMDAGVAEPVLYSDHLAIKCKVRICGRLKKRTSDPRKNLLRLDASQLKNQEISASFCRSVLQKYNSAEPTEDTYSKLTCAIDSTAKETLPKKTKAQPQWFLLEEETISKLIKERNEAMKAAVVRRTRSITERLRALRKKLKETILNLKNKWIQSKCRQMNEASGKRGTASCWKTLKEIKCGLSKTRPAVSQMMTKKDGSKCSTPEENAEVFRIHFKELFEREPSYDPDVALMVPQHPVWTDLDEIPSDKEIKEACEKLKDNAPGDSGLLPQFWKALASDSSTFDFIRDIVHDFWNNELPPEAWLRGLLKILPKKGDLSLADNYRGIMLLEAAYKIVAILLLNRLQPIAESLDQEQQCGFRPGRGCSDAIFNVRTAVKKRREHSLETWILFLDLVKAFDRVPRELLWNLLHRFGVPPKILNLLRAVHKDVIVKFEVEGVTHEVNCSIGVKQGDVLGPVLFTIFMVGVMTTWRSISDQPQCIFYTKEDSVMTGRKSTEAGDAFTLDDSEYADDTAALFVSREAIAKYSPLLVKHFARFGLEVHMGDIRKPKKKSKTECLFVAAPPSAYTDPATFDGADLSNIDLGEGFYFPIVFLFCYLGSVFTSDGKDDEDVKARIDAAGGAFGSMRDSLFSNASASFESKKIVYEGQIISILLYACESWSLTEKLFHLLRLFHARCVRAMCRVNRTHTRLHHISTDELLNRLGLKTIDSYITTRQLQWAGHVMRMGYDRLPRKLISSWCAEKRPVGCPSYTYGRGIFKALKKVNIDTDNWDVLAQNRLEWRRAITNIT